MVRKMYYDSFANEYCSIDSADPIAPPERYLLTYRGYDEFVETYENRMGQRLNIAYSEKIKNLGDVNVVRFNEAKRHGFDIMNAHMIKWTIPAKLFDKYAKMFGIKA
mgnify:CR=1 FL=1